MRILLVFPPRASATYAPLGIASLISFIKQSVPNAWVEMIDLNIETWIHFAQGDPQGQVLLDFLQGRSGNFIDPGETLSHKVIWDRLRQQMGEYAVQAKQYAQTGETGRKYDTILRSQAERILAFDPELVGFSVLFPEQIPFAAALANAVKRAAGEKGYNGHARSLKIVMGGAMMSALSVRDLLATCAGIDAVVCGEGEMAVAALASGTDWSQIPGLVYKNISGIVKNPKSRTLSLKSLPAPDFSRFPITDYFNPTPVLPVLFSRGCLWRKCRFCAHNFSFAGYRKKTVTAFVDELEGYCTTMGVRHFYSADEYIAPSDMDAIALEILARELRISYQVLGKPTHECTQERMALWAASGCRWIGWGVESGSQRLLDLINKGTRVSDIEKVLRASAQVGISNLPMMIFGLPTSSERDLAETTEFLERIYDTAGALSASAFVLFEGTHFARNARQYRLHVDSPHELLRVDGKPLYSRRLKFREISYDGSLRAPKGALEVSEWTRHRRWLGEIPLLEQLCSEHYLLHVSGFRQVQSLEHSGFNKK
ncbi:MAG: B12-binding domain-containing radical SAM protein [Proteobacteria bacterium]|nr:radical SAM protein [Desulfobacula sp.]MBU3951940.1 B12-binding domain-containing radical SAM protein [Pseudomonadota bacterium]MBU4130083.1 B12-binding domain-containing radical SAM protein [Pseudomonadota bacterium]